MKLRTLIAAAVMTSISSLASAEVRLGISGAWTNFDATGTETLKSSSNKTTSEDVGDSVLIPTIWAELASETGWALGIDYLPSTQIGSDSKTRPDTDTDDASDTAGTNTASADLDSHITYYISKQFGATPLYVKLGMARADVITTENLATGTSYGDATIDGVAIGLGLQMRTGNDWLIRAEYLGTDYDSISLTGSADADSVTNKVDADVDTTAFKISLGKAF